MFTVDIHYFIFILNADSALFATVVFAMSYVALRLIYRMWRSGLRCPHCGEQFKGHHVPAPIVADKGLPNTLWT
ncbi:MAG TPA: hypothetical protein VI816_02315 [Candidatus Bathyarchaeia archaeon]|nr:hypothetical protein [Candidatus Bathyarchaeia archaeon]